jgi:RNA-splicing ligase RtcB
VGAQGSMEQSFGSCCHGAGRRLSRTAAKKSMDSKDLLKYLDRQGVTVRVHSQNLLTEEAPQAYKDATTPIRMSFSLDYKSNENSHQREAVAVTVHAFNLF